MAKRGFKTSSQPQSQRRLAPERHDAAHVPQNNPCHDKDLFTFASEQMLSTQSYESQWIPVNNLFDKLEDHAKSQTSPTKCFLINGNTSSRPAKIFVNPHTKMAVLLRDVCNRGIIFDDNRHAIGGSSARTIVRHFFAHESIKQSNFTLLIPVSGCLEGRTKGHQVVLIAYKAKELIVFRQYDPCHFKTDAQLLVNCRTIVGNKGNIPIIVDDNEDDRCATLSYEFICNLLSNKSAMHPKEMVYHAVESFTKTKTTCSFLKRKEKIKSTYSYPKATKKDQFLP